MKSLKPVLGTTLAAALLAFAGSSLAAANSFKEGVNYVAVSPAQPTTVAPGQIEVIEFFWYGCPHCFAYEPYVDAWAKSKTRECGIQGNPGRMARRRTYGHRCPGVLHRGRARSRA